MSRPEFVVDSPIPPTVEVDTESLAAYIRFRKGKVAKTVRQPCKECFVAVDLDRQGRVVGIEVIGERTIEIGKILAQASVSAPNVDFSRVRYLPIALVPEVA